MRRIFDEIEGGDDGKAGRRDTYTIRLRYSKSFGGQAGIAPYNSEVAGRNRLGQATLHLRGRAAARPYRTRFLFPDAQGFDADDVGVAVFDGGKQFVAGFGVELDAATGGGGAVEDDVLDFFDVDIGATDLVHDKGEHADAVEVADGELPLRGGARGEVHAIEHDAGFDVGLDDADGFLGDGFLGLFGGRADVVGAVEIRQVKDRVGELGRGFGGFGIVDIEAGANPFRFERGAQGGLVDDLAAGGIDEDGVGFHHRDAVGADELLRVGLERDVQGDDVGAAEQGVEIGGILDVEVAGFLQVERAGPSDDVKAEGVGAFDDLAADLAEAHDAEGLPVDAVGFAEFFLVPFVGAERGDVVGNAAVDGQQQCEGEFGHGDGVFARAIRDIHAAGAGGFDVDGVDARARAKDHGELGAGLDGVGGDLFAADDEDFTRADELGKFLGFDGGVVGDVTAEFLETVEVVLGKFVGNQDLHINLLRGERSMCREDRTRERWLASTGCVVSRILWPGGGGASAKSGACNAGGESLDCAGRKELTEMDTAASKEDAGASTDGKKLRVLVVDDQPAVCEVVADTIAYAGHEIVGKAKDGVEAVSLAKELQPDLVVMDIAMPRMNGVDAMKAILGAKSAKRVLLMSGEYRSLGVTREEMMREGAAGFMEKPFNVSDLFELLDRWSSEERK